MSSEQYAIEVENISKSFKVYYDKANTIKERMISFGRGKFEKRKVLSDVSFKIKKGETVGLIGENGCGKSTTLKLLTRIIFPDSGSIKINGRVSSLLELGAGFHPDMSGRENIYINAAIFGLTKKEIDNRLNDIIEFSELGEHIDSPVRTYSSGMYMRLAFSVAINVNADILLIDEILAVGDTNFQAKCMRKLNELKQAGITIVIVTHDHTTVERFCDTAIWINEGKIAGIGKSADAVDLYLAYMKQKQYGSSGDGKNKNTERYGNGNVLIKDVRLVGADGQRKQVITTAEPISLEIDFERVSGKDEVVIGFGIWTIERVPVYGSNTHLEGVSVDFDKKGTIKFKIDSFAVLRGDYILQIAIENKVGEPLDFYRNYCIFSVVSNEQNVGLVHLNHEWEVTADE